MNRPTSITGNIEIARANAAMGIVSIPILPGLKVPAVPWKEWQDRMPPEELLATWFADAAMNIAIITTGLVVFDCDDPRAADLVVGHCGDTPYRLRTPRGGIHLGYRKPADCTLRNQVKINGLPIDLRTDGGLALIPHSRTELGAYEWLGDGFGAKCDLPVASVNWIEQRPRRCRPTKTVVDFHHCPLLHRGQKYVDTFERAVSGQGGHTTTFISALKIARFAGYDHGLAWQLLLYYNATKCDPPWDREAELQHKLDDAFRIGK